MIENAPSKVLRSIFFASLMFLALSPASVIAQDSGFLARVDMLIEEEKPQEALWLMERFSDNPEIYWRRSQAMLFLGDQRRDTGATDGELVDIFSSAERYADRTIALDPRNPEGYYWKAANIGRLGQMRGALTRLRLASDMRRLLEQAIALDPFHSESYGVLAQLYAQVPSGISFGNKAYAVSLGWKAVYLMEVAVASGERDKPIEAYYVELASHLIDRGWNEQRRSRSMGGISSNFLSASAPLERGFFFEGSLNRPNRSDRDDAREILQGTIRRMEAILNPQPIDTRRLQQARELLAKI